MCDTVRLPASLRAVLYSGSASSAPTASPDGHFFTADAASDSRVFHSAAAADTASSRRSSTGTSGLRIVNVAGVKYGQLTDMHIYFYIYVLFLKCLGLENTKMLKVGFAEV